MAHAKKSQTTRGVDRHLGSNRLLAALGPKDRGLIEPHLEEMDLAQGAVLAEPGEDVTHTYFPLPGMTASFVIAMRDGRTAKATTVGCEGAIGGIISAGRKPAFARTSVQIPGTALRLELRHLEHAKERSPALRDLFTRYSDAFLGQLLQSAACNLLHPLEERFCRWLLATLDRVGDDEFSLTQEAMAEMLGVHRATVVRVARPLQSSNLIRYHRGRIRILDRAGLEQAACECHSAVAQHFMRVLPEAVPQIIGYHAGHIGED